MSAAHLRDGGGPTRSAADAGERELGVEGGRGRPEQPESGGRHCGPLRVGGSVCGPRGTALSLDVLFAARVAYSRDALGEAAGYRA